MRTDFNATADIAAFEQELADQVPVDVENGVYTVPGQTVRVGIAEMYFDGGAIPWLLRYTEEFFSFTAELTHVDFDAMIATYDITGENDGHI